MRWKGDKNTILRYAIYGWPLANLHRLRQITSLEMNMMKTLMLLTPEATAFYGYFQPTQPSKRYRAQMMSDT